VKLLTIFKHFYDAMFTQIVYVLGICLFMRRILMIPLSSSLNFCVRWGAKSPIQVLNQVEWQAADSCDDSNFPNKCPRKDEIQVYRERKLLLKQIQFIKKTYRLTKICF
jgi:hypothetical protein